MKLTIFINPPQWLQRSGSGRHLIQNLKEDDFAREHIAPEKGISKSSFFEAMHDRGLEQFLYVFNALQEQACTVLPQKFPELGQLVAIDGSLIDSVLSMTWADYRGGNTFLAVRAANRQIVFQLLSCTLPDNHPKVTSEYYLKFSCTGSS